MKKVIIKDKKIFVGKNLSVMDRQSGLGEISPVRNDPTISEQPVVNNGTTQFIDDAIVTEQQVPESIDVGEMFLGLNDTQSNEEDLKTFLARPIRMASGAFATTDTVTTFTDFNLPHDAFDGSSSSIWADKLKGFYGIRCDFRFKIVFNSNRFQQGRYMLCWIPLCGSYTDNLNLRFVQRTLTLGYSLVQRTTNHHVEFDINSGTSAELLVPYQSVDTFFPIDLITKSSYDRVLGKLTLCPYSPLVSPSGSTTVPYTLYVSLENVRLFGAINPQSGLRSKEVSKDQGPVSSVARKFANSFDALTGVPLITDFALGASWVADRIAKTASIFGYSKPMEGEAQTKVLVTNNASHSTVDGDYPGKALSYMTCPGTKPLPGMSATKIDEMDFSYLLPIYSYKGEAVWSSGLIADDILMGVNLKLGEPVLYSGAACFGPLDFIAAHFVAWRGSLKYKFKIVKTEFHSGRLSIEHRPGDTLTGVYNPAYVNRQIIDIREVNEFTVSVPYISTTPFSHMTEIVGRLIVRVVDPLVNPATVASSVKILYEVAGGKDVEFAIPSNFQYTPTTVVERQSGVTSERHVEFSIGNSSVTGSDTLFSSVSIGDKVSNLRALLKRFVPMAYTKSKVPMNGTTLIIQPDIIIVPSGTYDGVAAIRTGDIMGSIAYCYGMWSGGVRVRDVINPTLLGTFDQKCVVKVVTYARDHLATVPFASSFTTSGVAGVNRAPLAHVTYNRIGINDTTVDVEFPQYTMSVARSVADCVNYGDGALSADLPRAESMTQVYGHFSISNDITVGAATATAALHNVYRSVADDCNLSVFISIPPLSLAPKYYPTDTYGL